MSDLAKTAGGLIRSGRQRLGWSVPQLLEKVGSDTLTKSLVSRYETGAVLISLDRLEAILQVMGETLPNELRDQYADVAASNGHMRQVGTKDTWKEFVRTWQTSADTREVCAKMGITIHQCHSRARNAKKHGVTLKPMPNLKGKNQVDWAALQALADSLKPE